MHKCTSIKNHVRRNENSDISAKLYRSYRIHFLAELYLVKGKWNAALVYYVVQGGHWNKI